MKDYNVSNLKKLYLKTFNYYNFKPIFHLHSLVELYTKYFFVLIHE